MKHRASSSDSDGNKRGSQDGTFNIRTKPPHIYDNLTRKLLKLGITLAIPTFIGLIVRYASKEFDPSVSTITVTTSRVNNRDIASLSVSKHFLERILEITEESISIVAAIIPIGFPLCSLFNKYFAKIRAGVDKIDINSDKVLDMIPKYVVIGDAQACQMPNSTRLRPLVRDTIYQLIKAHLKPKIIVEDSYDEARKLGIRIGLIKREHHKLAVIKSVDLLRNIIDSRGDIKQGKVRYLLSRMKIMSQSTPADKSLLIYLMKHCESMPNENLVYLGYSFTDPEAMRIADCAITFQDCDDDDVKKDAQVILKSEKMTFTDLYLFVIVCLLTSNITQSYALYQISASVACCLYRFLSIAIFQEQLISHSQFTLLIIIQQVFAIVALMTKWLSSLPQAPLRSSVAEMSHDATEDILAANENTNHHHHHHHHHHRQSTTNIKSHRHNRSTNSITGSGMGNGFESSSLHQLPVSGTEIPTITGAGTLQQQTSIKMHKINKGNGAGEGECDDNTLGSSSNIDSSSGSASEGDENELDNEGLRRKSRSEGLNTMSGSRGRMTTSNENNLNYQQQSKHRKHKPVSESNQHIHLSGIDLNQAVINSKLVTSYKQTFRNSALIDDVTNRLVKLQIAYQVLVMTIIMVFGNEMFQLNMNGRRQHETLAFNSLILNNIFNLANCFNQFGEFNLRSGFRNHPFFVCVLLFAVFFQVCLTELNAFGLENLNPIQWFVCFVFALLSALISPLTGQQQRYRTTNIDQSIPNKPVNNNNNKQQQPQQTYNQYQSRSPAKSSRSGNYKASSGKTRTAKHGQSRHNTNRKSQSASVLDD